MICCHDGHACQISDLNGLKKSGPDAPVVRVIRDDRVATLELDYVPGNPWTPFNIGSDGRGAVGYRVSWTPLRSAVNRKREAMFRKVTSLRRVQIQPLRNNEPYYVKVEYVNRFGEIVGDFAFGTIQGGNGRRVNRLRQEMTGFFDDFNQPAGLPDERSWNTSFSQTNDPAMQAFFVNPQFHTHTVVGTPSVELFGDRGQTTHRVRNKMVLGQGETRRIVFDIDGFKMGGRAIWYLDLVQEETEMTSHVTVGGGQGASGHPSPGLRFFLEGQSAAVFYFNEAGEQILIQENRYLEWDGVQTFPNVRRAVEIQLSQNHVTMLMDGVAILDTDLGQGAIETGEYTVLWSAFGYNTMKVGMPYFLIHWDNFGFDGPPSTSTVHNYRTQVAGTDLIRSNDFEERTVAINIPDDLTPTGPGQGEARLVFTRQMNNWDPVRWSAADTVSVNGTVYPVDAPTSSAAPPLQLEDLINSNAAYSTYIPLGTVGINGTSPLVAGENEIVFQASRCGFHNIHIEVAYPAGSEPDYTPPQELHPVPLHHHFLKVGLPARISHVGVSQVDHNVWYMNSPENFNASVNGTIEIGTLVNAEEFNNRTTLSSDFTSATLASAGDNPGIRKVELWIRPDGGDENSATLLGSVNTNAVAPAPQFIHEFSLDTTQFSNGLYELFVVAEDSRGVMSLPNYGGMGQLVSSGEELNGFYFPIHITIGN